ncbi:MAG: AAA family ATPase [bacterium]|nr:AAA family ATPase [bacterium]
MYLEYFGLKEKPFNVTPDPHFLYMSPSHQEAFANLLYGVRERKGFIMVTGEVGTGKTTLLHNLLNSLEDEIQTVFVFHTCLEFEDLLEMIHHELEIPVVSTSKAALLQSLNKYLIEQLSTGRNVAVIIDEAQNLSPEILENLRLLSNLETAKDKLLQIVLVGQPELNEKMALNQLRQLRQRVSVSGEIKTLTGEESKAYILHRLAVAGTTGAPLFSDEALRLLVNHAAGVPRKINVLCDNALLIAYADGNKLVGASHALEAIRDHCEALPAPAKESTPDPLTPLEDYKTDERKSQRGNRYLFGTMAVAAMALLLYISFNLGSRSTLSGEDITTPTLVGSAMNGIPVQNQEDSAPADDIPLTAPGEEVTTPASVDEDRGGAMSRPPESPTQASGRETGAINADNIGNDERTATSAELEDRTAITPAAAVDEVPGNSMKPSRISPLQQEFWSAATLVQLENLLSRCGRIRYTVASNDHFIGIVFDHTGRQDAIVLDAIESMNPHIRDYDHIEPGWVLYLPDFKE